MSKLFVSQTYEQVFRKSLESPEAFWAEAADAGIIDGPAILDEIHDALRSIGYARTA